MPVTAAGVRGACEDSDFSLPQRPLIYFKRAFGSADASAGCGGIGGAIAPHGPPHTIGAEGGICIMHGAEGAD